MTPPNDKSTDEELRNILAHLFETKQMVEIYTIDNDMFAGIIRAFARAWISIENENSIGFVRLSAIRALNVNKAQLNIK